MKLDSSISTIRSLAARVMREDAGAQLVEAVLVIGLIAVICLVAIAAVGPKIGIRWDTVTEAMGLD